MSALLSCMQIPTLLIPSISSSSSSREKKHHQCIQIPTHSLKHQLHSQSPSPRVIKCFSNRQSQSTEQEFKFEFERLFSNLNQATLKRESGNYFFFFGFLQFHLLNRCFNVVYRKFIQRHFSRCRHDSTLFILKIHIVQDCLVLWYCIL